jgi:hypothetical protein
MDWSNERYVRVYTRDTTTWKLMDWRGRVVLSLLFRKVDRAGVLDVGHDGVLGLAAVLELPIEIVEAGIAQLTSARGGTPTVVDTGTAYVLPNFIEAQEAPSSDPQRKRESRARRRDVALAVSRKLLFPAAGETDGHETGQDRDARSQLVTPICADPICADPESSLPARAIPPSTAPVPPPPTAPAVSPPAPARAFREQDPPARERTPGPREQEPTVREQLPPRAFDPDDAQARGKLAELTYRRVSDARLAIARELGLPEQLPFPAITPAARPLRFNDLLERIREEGASAIAACDRVVENLIAQARDERSIEWLDPKAFGSGAWNHARNRVAPPVAARAAKPPKRRADPPAPVVPREQLAGAAELAASRALLAKLTGAAVADLPTPELVKRFGDGQRAPPRSAGESTDDTDDEQPVTPTRTAT